MIPRSISISSRSGEPGCVAVVWTALGGVVGACGIVVVLTEGAIVAVVVATARLDVELVVPDCSDFVESGAPQAPSRSMKTVRVEIAVFKWSYLDVELPSRLFAAGGFPRIPNRRILGTASMFASGRRGRAAGR
ncbi:MAG TPA: hypothetical protein ENH15_05560 [Actinobacteria bacterium]|nr:hypothetical protein [Actinomycetota bacterium]